MKFPAFVRGVRPLAVALLAASLAGCIITNNSSNRVTGKQITADQLAQVKPGATKESVIDLLGVPSKRTDLGSGLEVWEWDYTENANKSSGFIFLYSSDTSTHVDQATSVEFKDGAVTKTWSK